MSSKPRKIWQVVLADSPPGAGSRNNSTRIIRTSVFEGSDSNIALTASGLCRKVVESSGEWLMKICHRHPAARDNRKACILVNYGCGFATLVLINGAELESSEHWKLHPIWVSVAVASVKSEESGKTSDARVQEYGIVSADDAIYDHLAELQGESTEGVRVYLHPTLAAGVFEGSFETDHETGHGDRKRIFRIWTESGDSLAISRLERDLELEKRLREGSLPSRPTKKARVEETQATNTSDGMVDAAKRTHSKKKTASMPPTIGATAAKASAVAAKGAKKTSAPKAATASASARSTLDKGSTKETPPPNKANHSVASVPAEPVLVPPVDENPQDMELAKKSAPVAVGPKPTPYKLQGAKKVSTNVAASKDIAPNINDEDTETKDNSARSKKREVSDGNSTHNKLGFHPREIVLLAKAFDEELDEADLMKKVINKSTGKAAYSEKDIKLAKRILERVDKEVEEMRAAASDLERLSVSTTSEQATETITKATDSEKNSHEKATGTTQESDPAAGRKQSASDSSSEAPNSSKKPPAKDKETGATLKRKPGRPKGSKSKPKTAKKVSEGGKDDEVESTTVEGKPGSEKNSHKKTTGTTQEGKSDSNSSSEAPNSSKKPRNAKDKETEPTLKQKPGRPKGSKSKPETTPEEEEATTKASVGDKDDDAESTTVEEKNNQAKTAKGIADTPKPPAASETTTAKKTPIDSTTTANEETHSEPTKKRKPGRPKGSKSKTAKAPSSSKRDSKTAKKKSSKHKRSSTSSSPRTRTSNKDKT